MEKNHIGIVGGGQLGRMLTEAAKPMGFEVTVLDPADNSPAFQAGANQIRAGLNDREALQTLAAETDVVTWEIEHIDAAYLFRLQHEHGGVDIQPAPADLLRIQDKLDQKTFLRKRGIPVADFMPVGSSDDLDEVIRQFGPAVVKSRRGGYDGRGNLMLTAPDWRAVLDRFGDSPNLYAERVVDFQKELSVIIVRGRDVHEQIYPVIETEQRNGQCEVAIAPARIANHHLVKARELARDTIDLLNGRGVFAIEMFLTEDDEILVNEIAPRVHNSGHHTMEANLTSQFEQHVRAITGLPLGSVDVIKPAAMVNILGERDGPVALTGLAKALSMKNTYVHIYGKQPTKLARKMGHITALADDATAARARAINARREISI